MKENSKTNTLSLHQMSLASKEDAVLDTLGLIVGAGQLTFKDGIKTEFMSQTGNPDYGVNAGVLLFPAKLKNKITTLLTPKFAGQYTITSNIKCMSINF